MLPAHLAENIRQQILFYLQATFEFRDESVEAAFEEFVLDEENGLFKGPWVQLRRPFTPVGKDVAPPFDVEVPFQPFLHQMQSWERLSSRDGVPRSTLVTTGTGSGKTECFLFPILDHCLRMAKQGQKGIKAIVLYPMNALAADQEKRFAKTIWERPELRGAGLRVGNYTGRFDASDPAGSKDSGHQRMGADHGISHHGAQLDHPPDILLTNYKMLDFLLMRPQDQRLWRFNEGGVLRYLVLDELHTYDGAQGADVACLIRRLKERLAVAKGDLCAIGTSATLHQDEDGDETFGGGLHAGQGTSEQRLSQFASKLFEEDIRPEAVIGESRLDVDEILEDADKLQDVSLPAPEECEPRTGETASVYARRQADLWAVGLSEEVGPELDEEAELAVGSWLKARKIFGYLLRIFAAAEKDRGGPLTWDRLIEDLSVSEMELNRYKTGEAEDDPRSAIVLSLLALVAHAKERRSGRAQPLVPTQVQLWVRELRRLGRVVAEKPEFRWIDEPTKEAPSLPAFHCSECGESGWIGLRDPAKDTEVQLKGGLFQMKDSSREIYQQWFARGRAQHGQYIVIISPRDIDEEGDRRSPGPNGATTLEPIASLRGYGSAGPSAGVQLELETEDLYFCPQSLVLRKGDGPCPITEDARRFRVRIDDQTAPGDHGRIDGIQGCPRCASKEAVLIIGSQAATLASLAIDEMFGSILNNDPKLLAFTDSVQDASHRAGFFSARTFNFTFRTALQQTIDAAGRPGLPLPEVGKRVLEWASQPVGGRPGSLKEAMAALMPPDLQQYPGYLEFRNGGAETPPPELLQDIEQRLSWQATSEYGLMQLRGRTLETNMSAVLAWDEERVTATVEAILAGREGVDPGNRRLLRIEEPSWRLWLYGILHRYRLRGALDHPYLRPFTKVGHWGKTGFRREPLRGHETHPPTGRFRPRLLLNQHERRHDHLLAPSQSGLAPWPILWTRRSLSESLDEAVIIDLLRYLLAQCSETELFRVLREDGLKKWHAINADAARLVSQDVAAVRCSDTGRLLVRPTAEAKLWVSAPSLEYRAKPDARYRPLEKVKRRQKYYQQRYQKGALRRVTAVEHTGLLKTSDREEVERRFAGKDGVHHEDDPNVLTCTSTLEMGIDIGDLSSTMLCAIPPSTANYIQRIGRAGRETGTALIVAIVNQKPHDLFFFARPGEMIRGVVDPPGCWLDASAVLVRHYLGFCFDTAVQAGALEKIPRTGGQLVEDWERTEDGHLPRLFRWIGDHEEDLRSRFLDRFAGDVEEDTRERFVSETESTKLRASVEMVKKSFEKMRRDFENARKRLRHRLQEIEKTGVDDKTAEDAREEIERELKILQTRGASHARRQFLELLTDEGLLPNYAFPERGVPFYGSVYHTHGRKTGKGGQRAGKAETVELIRPASSALSELAPGNHFYTHSRRFDIQQLSVGNDEHPLIKKWAICGACGHMRLVSELGEPGSGSACPQCGHDGDSKCQFDQGQQRDFLEMPTSQASSYMEHYESLSADRDEERQRARYQRPLKSFDTKVEAASGAVLDDELPFGIEFFAAVVMREVNAGFDKDPVQIPFGAGRNVPEEGFKLCGSCGVALLPGKDYSEAKLHRRNCSVRRSMEEQKQKGKRWAEMDWRSVYLYRELRSEAIRLLLHLADDTDLDTLTACLYLGLRLRFGGSPHHLVVAPHILPDSEGVRRHYLLLLDGVPGGTGYLKALFQEKEPGPDGRPGEGILDVLRRAHEALRSCRCRRVRSDDSQDTDGCYRCLRAYHLQYRSESISRERGIVLLDELIQAGEKRVVTSALENRKYKALYDSLLEKKVVDALRIFVQEREGTFEKTVVRGATGFVFTLPGSSRVWELEMHPHLGKIHGVMVDCEPDFVLRCDDDFVLPVAIFADGFEYHCHPHNRLADDLRKRRAILASGQYHVWSLTWDDLAAKASGEVMTCHAGVLSMFTRWAGHKAPGRTPLPSAEGILRNGFVQLKAFLDEPNAAGWRLAATFLAFFPLHQTLSKRSVASADLQEVLGRWRAGDPYAMASLVADRDGDQVYGLQLPEGDDVVTTITVADALATKRNEVRILARLDDGEEAVAQEEFKLRWRRFLACLNLFQFCRGLRFWAASEAVSGEAPELPGLALAPAPAISDRWSEVAQEVTPKLRSLVEDLATRGVATPEVERYNELIDDDAFAELAWPEASPPVALLAGDQADFKDRWTSGGWTVVTDRDLLDGVDVLTRHLV